MKNPWLKKEVVEMRAGMMRPYVLEQELPAAFLVQGISIHRSYCNDDSRHMTLYCKRAVDNEPGDRMIWKSENVVHYAGREHRLVIKPSDRGKWQTFTFVDPDCQK